MNSEINELQKKVREITEREGLHKLLDTLAIQAISELNNNKAGITLNSFDLAILKLMMIDYLKNNFNRNT